MSHSNQKMALYQYHHSVAPADAVTRHMMLIQSTLAEEGIESRLFASQIHPSLQNVVAPFPDASIWNADLLLIHHSMGNPHLKKVLGIEVPKAMVFHNVTPPEFFRHDPFLRRLSALGVSQLGAFRGKLAASFGVSQFNVERLREAGLSAKQLPLLDLQQALTTANATPQPGRGRPRLIFVGKICAHKNQALLVRALRVIKDNPATAEAELTLVGREDPIYGKYVRALCRSLGVEKSVTFAGRISDFALAAHYLSADVFTCSSLHEGFCIPLVEAMRFGVPVIALKRGAVAETLGDSGLLIEQACEHAFAHAVSYVATRPQFREAFVLRQNARIVQMKRFQNRDRLRELLLSALFDTRKPLQKRKLHERSSTVDSHA